MKKEKRNLHGPFPVVRSSGLFLWAFSGNGPRFAQFFRNAWKRIPMRSRRELLSFWRARAPHTPPPWPHIEMFEQTRHSFMGPSGNAIAQTQNRGCAFWFLAPLMDVMPEEPAQVLVAHELAHAYLTSRDPNHIDKADSEIGYLLCEHEVSEVLYDYWDFDPEILENWKNANRSLLDKISSD